MEAEVAKAIHLRALESAAAKKDTELTSSNSQVSVLEITCSGLRDEVMGYKMFEERANYVGAITALRAMDFPLLTQLESQKDASMTDIMDLLRLEDPAAVALEASHLQPSPEKLMVPIHRLKDQVVIRETFMAFSLDVAHTRIQRIRGDVAARRMSLTDVMVPLIEPLSVKSLTGEANSYRISTMAVTIALSTTLAQASTVPPAPSTEVPPLKIMFEQEELDTTPKHTSAL
nr:hypothetical protein [Tanacetum cinerariifolium]